MLRTRNTERKEWTNIVLLDSMVILSRVLGDYSMIVSLVNLSGDNLKRLPCFAALYRADGR